MQIVLNADLELIPTTKALDAQEWSQALASKYQISDYSNQNGQLLRAVNSHQFLQLGFVRVVARAYSNHMSLAIQPHDIWHVILSNFVGIVNDGKADDWRPLLTNSEEKAKLIVPQEHLFEINVEALLSLLKEHSPTDPVVFQPVFSTTTPAAQLATAAAVLDMAARYYDYGMFCCGIPSIDLRGTREDWIKVATHVDAILTAMHQAKLSPRCILPVQTYFNKVQGVISQIILSYEQDQTEFWKDIWTQKNVGSGGDLKINGWICDLYHKIKRDDLIRSFPDLISEFTYTNVDTNEHFLQRHGCFGSEIVDGVLETRYDYIVIKYNPK